MVETIASWILALVGLYVLFGVLFAVPFVLRGVKRIDPDAEQGSWGFRVLIFPGSVALWPLLARRLRQGPDGLPVERTPHRRAAEARR